ncbi:MAG: response regulator [Bacteroidia bacterium]
MAPLVAESLITSGSTAFGYKSSQHLSSMTTPLKILLLEDNNFDVFLLKRELNKSGLNYSMEAVSNRTGFTESLIRFKPDLVLSDHILPGFDSFEAFKIAKNCYPDIPFIMVTGSVSEDFAVECLKAGIDDYILKGSLLRLPAAIESVFYRKD